LIEHFMTESAQLARDRHLSAEALQVLLNYPWPGNVRELQNTIERATVLCSGEEITAADLPPHMTLNRVQVTSLHEAFLRHCSLAELEREYIMLTMELSAGNKSAAADLLGVDRKTLYRKLAEYGWKG
jgi:DNA-binding NtrC family response regulator